MKPTLALCAPALCAPVLCATVLAAGSTAAQSVPPLMLPYGSGWSGGIDRTNGLAVPPTDFLPSDFFNGAQSRADAVARGVPADKVEGYLLLRGFGHYIPPAGGLGIMVDDPQHPYFNNAMARSLGPPLKTTVRVADLTTDAAKNLKPWALEAVRKQNELALAGRNTQTRQARCWQLGVPNFDEAPQPLYFIQTPAEVVMYMGHRVRHIYMNVPHAENPKPSWYGESVGHYEGDTLVVDTIGQNDKSFVDGYRTPHTTQIHVVERFRVVAGGKGLETAFTVDDPGAFNAPWSGRRARYLVTGRALNDIDRICAVGNEDRFNTGLDPLQKAATPDF